ncbi:MAG TPA: hypothetical protein VEA69_09060, partial [Tepidisphaeraceae bacterium]|nr:hypothetical protein [Tepidisphaeraceae bacterium]
RVAARMPDQVGLLAAVPVAQLAAVPVAQLAAVRAVVLAAAVKAVEHVDICVGRILEALRRQDGVAIVTADHGNCEQMIDPSTGGPHTAHTTFPVELICVDDRLKGKKLLDGGRLADVAPTALTMMGLAVPSEMNGKSLIG